MKTENLFLKSIYLTVALFFSQTAFAQTIVGRAAVGGDIVVLYSDNTWAYEADASSTGNCKSIHERVEFCGATTTWKPVRAISNEITAQYNYDDRHYGQFVIEGFGFNDGLTHEGMRELIISIAAGASEQRPEDIVIIDIFDSEIDGNDAQTTIYVVDINGLKFVFENTIMISDTLVIQAVTYALGSEYTDQLRDLTQDFLSVTKIN